MIGDSGWMCPKCSRVYSPNCPCCPKCNARVDAMGDITLPISQPQAKPTGGCPLPSARQMLKDLATHVGETEKFEREYRATNPQYFLGIRTSTS